MTKFTELLYGPAEVAEAHLQEGASEEEVRAAVCNALRRIGRLEDKAHCPPEPAPQPPRQRKEGKRPGLRLLNELIRANVLAREAQIRSMRYNGRAAGRQALNRFMRHMGVYEKACGELRKLLEQLEVEP